MSTETPENCPGPESEKAGYSDACATCPSRQTCQTTPKGPDPDLPRIKEAMKSIKHKILVLSGKGGVGKSTISSQLAFALAGSGNISGISGFDKDSEADEDELIPARQVGLLDVDICGPSIPRIMGLEGEGVHPSALGWEPVFVDDNLAVMSVGFLATADDAMIWRGPRKNGLIKQFIRDVHWGDLDYLVVDTPPGTSDEHLSILTYLKGCGITGAVVVTTPQEVALADVRKEINFCKKVGIPILGVVENMSGFICNKCGTETEIFMPSSGGAERMCKEMDVTLLGKIPIDLTIAKFCDEGKSFVAQRPDSKAAMAYKNLFEKIIKMVENI